MTYPVAEVFHSVQGEGVWTGTPMMFVRLAGCNVGKYHNLLEVRTDIAKPADFPLYEDMKHSVCTTIDGQRFLCDTDYHKSEERSVESLEAERYEEHVCITGGEPFLHDLELLYDGLNVTMLHVETSGTKPIIINSNAWITCCPKQGLIEENIEKVDEWKYLVGPNFDESWMVHTNVPCFLQPINGVNDIDEGNLQRCLELLKKHPNWRLSAQLHKYIKVR